MRINWVEHLEKEGQISSSAKEEIYTDCMQVIKNSEEIIKTANAPTGPAPNPLMMALGAGFMALKGKDAYHNFRMPAVVYKDIQKNRASLSQEEFIKDEKDVVKAEARFNEIVEVAPSVAQDYTVSKKLVEKRLHSGLSEADVMTLGTMQRQFYDTDDNRLQFKLKDKIKGYEEKDRMRTLKKSAEDTGETYATIYSIVKEACGSRWLPELVDGLEKQSAFSVRQALKKDVYHAIKGAPKTVGKGADSVLNAYKAFMREKNISQARRGLEASKETMTNLTEKLEEAIEKAKPEPFSAGKLLKSVGLLTSIPLGVGVGLGSFKHLEKKLDQRKMKKKLRSSFEAVMGSKDDTGAILRSEKNQAQEAFDTLSHFAPNVAMQPTAAKSFMAKMISMGGAGTSLTSDEVKNLAQTQDFIRKGKTTPFSEGFGAGAGSMGLQGAMSSGLGGAADVMSGQLGSAITPPV